MKKKKTLLELRTQGFHKTKKGKIHLRCPYCGRKTSNVDRQDYDPEKAFLVEIACDNCCQGCKDNPQYYYDKKGKEITPKEIF